MKVTIKGFVSYSAPYGWDKGAHGFHFFQHEMVEHGYATVQPHEFEIEVPDNFDPRPQQVAALQAEQQKVRAEFAARIVELDRQISELTCLEAA